MLIRRDEHNLDKKFRQKLYDAEEAVPLHLWESVRRQAPKKRRPILWWYMAAILISGLFAAGVLYSDSQTKIVSSSAPQATSTLGQEITRSENAPSQQVEKTVGQVSNEELRGDNSPAVLAKDEIAPLYSSKLRTPKNQGGSSINARSHSDHASFKEDVDSKVITGTFPLTHQGNKTGFGQTEESPAIVFSPTEKTTEPKISILGLHATAQMEQEILADNSLPSSGIGMTQKKPVNHRGKWMIGGYYAISDPRRIASNDANALAFRDFDRRTNSGIGKSMGIAIGYSLYKGIFLIAGAETSGFKEYHSWSDTISYINYTYDVNYNVTYPNSDTMPVINMVVDTTQRNILNSRSFEHVNAYSSFNVPLLLGYRHSVWKNFSVIAEAGPVFRFERGYMGSFVFTKVEHPSEASITTSDGYQTSREYVYLNSYYAKWRTDMHTGLALSYSLPSGLGLRMGLQCRWMMQKADEIKDLSHRIVQPGINMGVNYWF